MAIYDVTTLTFATKVPIGSGTVPFSLNHTFSVPDGGVTQTAILDDDETFDTISISLYEDKSQQTLAQATKFGNLTYPAGARLGLWNYSKIEQLDGSGAPTGNYFFATFPREFKSAAFSSVIGEHYSVLIFPVPTVDADGQKTFPTFDPSASYKVQQHIQTSVPTARIDYYVAPPVAAPCFTTGTLIECDSGPRQIETIRPGDLVRTRDNGLRRVRWIGGRTLDASALDLNPAFRPIRIRAGALGNGLPRRDLTVSPQHRVLVQSTLTRQLCGEAQVLVGAKHLTDIDGIDVVRTATDVTYWHMLLDGHELVRSNGAWTETLYTGPEAMKSLAPGARREILMLFPELRNGIPMSPPARPFLKGRDGRKIARHHARQNAELVEA